MFGPATIFEKDFQTKEGDFSLDSFDEIRNVPAAGAQRLADGFGISLAWNIFLLRTPALKEYSLQCEMAKGADPVGGFDFSLYFHYDEKTHTAGILELSGTSNTWTGRIGLLKDHKITYAGPEVTWGDTDCRNWEFEIQGDTCWFASQRFKIPRGVPAGGRIGFANIWVEELKFDFTCLKKIKVLSRENVQYTPVFERRNWELPQEICYPMSRWIFSLEGTACENAVLLHAAIEGGPANVPNNMTFSTRHLGNEYIENPYFRIVRADGTVEEKQYIYYGKIGFHEHWSSLQPAIAAADTECPVKQNFYLKELPGDSRLILGFEKIRSEDRQYLPECGREMLVDPFSGQLIGARKMDHGEFHISVNSSADKEICRMIPETAVDYEKALRFAQSNHFFFEDEACDFEISGEVPADYCTPKELSLRIELEDVFKQPLQDRKADLRILEAGKSLFPDMQQILAECRFGTLAPGVYHLRTELLMNGEILTTERTAFESMSRAENALSAPEISGLPALFSAHTDSESSTNPFDPWGEGGCNSAHYTSISGQQILFSERRREWEVLKLYRRRLFSWYMDRSTKDPAVMHHLDSARNSSYVAGQDLYWRFLANDRGSYTEEYRQILGDFLKSQGNDAMAAEALDPEKEISMEYVEKLLNEYGIRWPAHVASLRIPEREETIREWIEAGVGKDTFCNYSFAPYYVTHTGVAFTALRYGRDLRDHHHPDYSAFSLAEDYPMLCSYPMICGCFTFSNLKLDMPDLNLWPEVYGISGIPVDTASIPNHLPAGVMDSEIIAKKFYDFKCRTCWFRDGSFHFWNDNGFHMRNPSEKEFNVLIDTWHTLRQWKPVKPLRSMAVIGGAECLLKHKPTAEIKSFAKTGDYLDFYNTAEDFPAFVYLSTRQSGLPNGFVVRADEIRALSEQDVSTLVLPPMDCFTEEEKDSIRKLFDAGVNIVCSEAAEGLEDLFGVKKCAPHPVRQIGDEVTNARHNPVLWEPEKDVDVLLEDIDHKALLTLNKGRSGAYAVFFTFAPTAFRRCKITAVESSSNVLEEAIDRVFRLLESDTAQVTISKGRINAFRDESGDLVVIAMEDAHPLPKKAITPLLTVKGDFRDRILESDARYTIVEQTEEKTLLRLHLAPDEARYFRFRKSCRNAKRNDL